MPNLPRDPWQNVTTYNGFPADHIISALQKEIRRGHTENATLLAYEMVLTSPALEDFLWQRLMIISVEDVGFGDPQAPVLINALVQMLATFDRSVAERKLFAVHAVRYLCQAQKDRASDEMINWMMHERGGGHRAPHHPRLRPGHAHGGRAKDGAWPGPLLGRRGQNRPGTPWARQNLPRPFGHHAR